MSERQVTALVLAGQREGRVDPLAEAAGLTLKCLVPVAGKPMVTRVVETLAATPGVGPILISVNTPEALLALPDLRALAKAGRLRLVPARPNIADSVLAALEDASWPVLVTTADNVLLTPDSAAGFIAGARRADVAVAFARREDVLTAIPDGQRRFYRFSCGAYSNCNTYWIGSVDALGPVEAFREGGQFAKHPARIARAFGVLNLIRFRLGLGTLDAAFRRFSKRYGRRLVPVILADGAVAVDVDNARTLAVAEAALLARAGNTTRHPGSSLS